MTTHRALYAPPYASTTATGPLHGIKLSIPRLPLTVVERTRLLGILDSAIVVPITAVTAPAGYGKTTTVAQWATSSSIPVSWISLGPEDNNPSRFFTNLIAATREADPDTLKEALDHQAGPTQNLHDTMEVIASAMSLATRDFVVVFDDFHCISNTDIIQAFAFLMNRLPPQAHFIVVSRTVPSLPLGRLRANSALCEIETADLAFSVEESESFWATSGIAGVDDDQWATVAERTEGWIAGMQLAKLSLKGQEPESVERFVATFDGSLRQIDDYLLEEVIAILPTNLKYFMVRSSLLPYLIPDLCDHALETDRSALLMREIRQRGLFVVSLDSRDQRMRYHPLFADALKRRFTDAAEPNEIANIHARAAEWLGSHDYPEEAIHHAIVAHRWDLATTLVHRICAPLAVSDRVQSMRYWLDQLPRDIVMDDPELRYLMLWSLAVSVAFDQSAAVVALIDSDDPDPTFQARVHTVLIQTSYAVGDVEGIHAHGQAARELFGDDEGEMLIPRMLCQLFDAVSRYMVGEYEEADATFAEYRRLGEIGPQPWIQNPGEGRYADALCLQGRLDDAEILLNQVQSSSAIGLHPSDVQAFWFMASIHLERNELDRAETNLVRGMQVVDTSGSEHWAPPILVTQAMIDWARGNAEAAHSAADRAREIAKSLGNPNFAQRAEALQSMMWTAMGQHILAERWLATANLNLTWVREFNQPYPALAEVRLLTVQGDLEAALARLNTIIDATTARRRTGDLVRLHTIRAGILIRRDEPDAAAADLATALDLGAPGGFVRSFLDEGAAIAGLFNHPLIRDHTHRHYAQSIRHAFDAQPASLGQGSRGQIEALSLRELEVLRLVSSGQSNRGIAQDLYISEPTVKKHVSNILGKLDVLNRTQAVSIAREMGVL